MAVRLRRRGDVWWLDFRWNGQRIRRSAETSNRELAEKLGADPAALKKSIDRWNAHCTAGKDVDFGRPSGTMMPITTPPFYGAQAWPICTNTQGGPVHDEERRIVDVYGKYIPNLYSAGEMGSAFGHLYLSGGNIAECFISGRIAGANACRGPV